MGTLDVSNDGATVSGELQDILDNLLGSANDFMDDIGAILQENMEIVTPIGDTNDLYDKTTVESEGLQRSIYSKSDHFDPVVDGHMVYGPVFSDRQRRWWFWYLENFLGGDYDVKVGSGNKMEANDYPLEAVDLADGDIEMRASEFLDLIAGD